MVVNEFFTTEKCGVCGDLTKNLNDAETRVTVNMNDLAAGDPVMEDEQL